MMRTLLIHRPVAGLVAFAALSGAVRSQQSAGPAPGMLPTPRQVVAMDGRFVLGAGVVIHSPNPELAAHARVLQHEILALTGTRVALAVPDAPQIDGPLIELRLAPDDARDTAGLPVESYSLAVTSSKIAVAAASVPGVSWATSTLLQRLVPGSGEAPSHVPCFALRDAPAAPYRSVMVDVARSPHSIGVLRGVVRLARLYKIRFVQLHLTDDPLFTFPFAPVTDALPRNYVYDRDELAALVEYADARGVTLIPEIDMPGHTRRLIESNYLEGAKSDADVAHEKHDAKVRALLDAVIDFFPSSPYFHIGGDESGAGASLVPFLGRVNAHVRSRGKRLIVWEGFHGAPTDALPATGEDRVLVAAWESSYNPPWNLLDRGYEILNASWRPLYVVGGDSLIHPGSSAGRSWTPAELGAWHKDRFMHWEPGRPVFEDQGPGDADRDDGIWDVPKPEWRDRVLGGQVSVWEQRESSLLRDLRRRIPVVAEWLWSGTDAPTDDVLRRAREVDQRLWGLVQPIEIRFDRPALSGPMERVAYHYAGNRIGVTFHNRTRLPGVVRWSHAAFGGNWNWIDFAVPKPPSTTDEDLALGIEGGAAIRAGLFLPDGERVGAESWARCVNWPMRVRVTEYDVGRRVPAPGDGVGDGRIPRFDAFGNDRITARHELPMLRGPLAHEGVKGQRFDATLVASESGAFELAMKTQSGHATLWLDLDGDGAFAESERLIPETPNTEERIRASVTLEAGRRYALRVDHVSALPRPVVIVTLDVPGAERPRDITRLLAPL